MTLSVINDRGMKVLGVDMLSKGTMRAGTGGDLLARALNDLTFLQECSLDQEHNLKLFREMESGISPRPWFCQSFPEKKRLTLCDSQKKQIAAHTFSKKTTESDFLEIVRALEAVVEKVNRL